ncbi:12888_t:CDS:2, partial [Cetraspora pellucida]
VEGLSSVGTKKDMPERLAEKTASKLKEKDLAVINQVGQASDCVSYVEDQLEEEVHRKDEEDKLSEERKYLMLERSLEKSLQATLVKALNEMKQSLHVIGNKVEEDKFWQEVKMNRPRDQHKINVGVQKLAYIQVYTLRVPNKEGQNIAAALRDSVSEDLMEAALKEKFFLLRQSARSKKRKINYSSSVSSSESHLVFSQSQFNLGTQNMQFLQKFSEELVMGLYATL